MALLLQFLLSAFQSNDALAFFIATINPELNASLPARTVPQKTFVLEAASVLRAHGYLDVGFFDRLAQAFPRRAAEVAQVAGSMGITLTPVADASDANALPGGGVEHRLRDLKEQRAEIRELLALFERAAFQPYDKENGGDPTAAFNAIQETRIALGRKGAAYLKDRDAATYFKYLFDELAALERQVQARYPGVVDLAAQWVGKPTNTRARIETIQKDLGRDYDEAAIFIRAGAGKIYDSRTKARSILQAIDDRLNHLLHSHAG